MLFNFNSRGEAHYYKLHDCIYKLISILITDIISRSITIDKNAYLSFKKTNFAFHRAG